MSHRSALRFCLVALMALSIPVLLPPAASAASCNVVQITTSIWNGQPTLQCTGEGDIAVKIVVTISGACSSTQTFYRCGQSTESYQFSACGKTHTVSLSGGNWEDAIADCSVIGYSAQ